MPKITPFKQMSKAEQEAYLASMPKPAPSARPDKVVRVAREPRPVEPSDRDGLLWLAKKKRLTTPQVGAGLYVRGLFRRDQASGVSLKSSLDVSAAAGVYNCGKGGGLPLGGDYTDAQAKLELFVVRELTLGKQPDLLLVVDGVCGLGHTVRFLAGNNQLRAAELEASLRIALDLIAKSRRDKEEAAAKMAA